MSDSSVCFLGDKGISIELPHHLPLATGGTTSAGTGPVVWAALCRDIYAQLEIVLALLVFSTIARPLVMAVTVDRLSVTFKGMFSENSIERSSITALKRTLPVGLARLIVGNLTKKALKSGYVWLRRRSG